VWGTGVLVEALLDRGADEDLTEAEQAIDWVASLAANDGSAMLEITVLRLRALQSRARGDGAYPGLVSRYCTVATALGFDGHIAWAEALIAGGP
jgi:phospholipid N-methyltransferase